MDQETRMMFELIIDKMDTHFEAIDKKFDAVNERFDGIDRRLDAMDERFDGIDRRFDAIDGQLAVINGRLDTLENTVGYLKARQDRDSRKLNDLQLQMKIFERDTQRNFARLNDSIDTIVEVLKLNGLIPR